MRAPPRAALLALALAACRGRSRPHTTTHPPRPDVVRAPPAPPAAPRHLHRPSWAQGFMLRRAPPLGQRLWDVAVAAPSDFDASRPLHVIILAHGWGHNAMGWLASGAEEVLPGRPPIAGWGGRVRHDLAGTDTLLVVPQFSAQGARRWERWFARPRALREFLDELLGEALAPRLGRALSADDVGSLTLMGSSAGGFFIDSVLAHSDLAPRVRNVAFLDALYVEPDRLVRWLTSSPEGVTRRLVSIDGGGRWTSDATRALLQALPPRLRADAAVHPRVALTEAIRAHRVVIQHSAQEHITMGILHLIKILQGFDLPRRPPCPEEGDPKSPWPGAAIPARPVQLGAAVRGALDASDPTLRDGSAVEDWAVELPGAAPVTVSVRGDREAVAGHAELDVLVRLLRDGEVVAENDDDGGRLRARLTYTPPSGGRYVVRVTTHGPWVRAGAYTLEVR